jgi:hypothetical protein
MNARLLHAVPGAALVSRGRYHVYEKREKQVSIRTQSSETLKTFAVRHNATVKNCNIINPKR